MDYWQQKVNYSIQVTLVDSSKRLNANMSMLYINNSPDTLSYIWMHVWPNAFKNDRTAFSESTLKNNNTDFYFSNEEARGYINRMDFSADGHRVETRDHPLHQDIVQLILPTPLLPHDSILIKTGFHVKLPQYFSRMGYLDNQFMIAHWYPKAAVYDAQGWHEMPYLDLGEYYQNFGDYEVEITAASKFVVAATGEKFKTTENNGFSTHHFTQKNVTDFAWFANPNFNILKDTLQLDHQNIQIYIYHHSRDSIWDDAIQFTKNTLRQRSEWLGAYPFSTVNIVEGPADKKVGGMEYPTLCILSGARSKMMLDYLIQHEVGHNWFYGMLSNDERKYPWMDEGMNSYYDKRYLQQYYGKSEPDLSSAHSKFLQDRMPESLSELLLESAIAAKEDQPISTTSENLSARNYSLVAYTKAALWMEKLAQIMGKNTFDDAMKDYVSAWKFKHPTPEDFKKILQNHTELSLDTIFQKLHQKGSLTEADSKKLKLKSFFGFKDTDKNNYIWWQPAVGYNLYDGIMPGLIFHNYTLPAQKFRFLLAPLYGTHSGRLNGTARLSYDYFLSEKGNRLQLSLSGSSFTADNFKDSTGKTNHQPYYKIVPALKYVFAQPDGKNRRYSFVQWKTFFIQETGLSFQRDTVEHVNIIRYPKINRYVNQLKFSYEDNRKLYPFRAEIQIDQGEKFIRAGFTGNYYFNYAESGGLNLRLFAGKFVYLQDRTYMNRFYTDAFHLNLSGAKGYEDYTYSNYFIGRNEFDGFANQQIMIRDGGFKVRTDLLADKIGKTDHWLAAVNLSSSVPDHINPLSLLPVKIPLKIFADVGTYAEAWDKNSPSGKFLYDAGLQFSILQNCIQIYVPLLYSKVYKDYFKSTLPEKRFWKTISFSINFEDRNLRNLIPFLNL